ncbi:phospholipase effector Tle1 domain-containing protein [endosymbiont of Ridgeia piscesae]|jgi:uncharacterized protein (DUF2235 family)|uniref:Uncharacterized alpha/beta hydrolase domain (DUF2235) n=1 Tax=endosymbiont of Ridgeia piscesae TaxID=54398 RepID=A0A0T5YYB9_9GAMM|nr:DUF2235 domain-containing protein [endosymbiont of Ridgeia piscesae]KRT55641.1 Uncharacterized alpha/beta hydrolase domain (DUF2235) [endosymbiont of Ridgeia piscesae]KRT56948.1 Uncharacterized alpha/beta hydrolase domain (DUF2235) [endosymbiont of Ridgeia piscesae]
MALYAFDGTGNEDNPGEGEDTNVLKFFRAYENAYSGPGKCFYVAGVGTRYSVLGDLFGKMLGIGGHQRIGEAMDQLEANFRNGDRDIDIIGFSRGAALALEFANDILEEGVNGEEAPTIRFMGLWETVASFGIPGNRINLGYDLTLPYIVQHCCHAIALDERRQLFPLTRVVQDAYSDRELRDIREAWFRGYHSDVGGGNNNEGLSNIPLYWMYQHAQRHKLPLDDVQIKKASGGSNSWAECKTPGMDRMANKKRTIYATDLVHNSVMRRTKAGRFAANNPPVGLCVVDDAGEIVGKGFEKP